jgi:hypothetical protein
MGVRRDLQQRVDRLNQRLVDEGGVAAACTFAQGTGGRRGGERRNEGVRRRLGGG